jgi:hypothetical protein
MGGKSVWELPEKGRQHHVIVDGERWEIRPPFDAFLMVSQAAVDCEAVDGAQLTPGQLAVVKRACVDHMLSEEQREAFVLWGTERQGLMAEKLWLVYNEMRSGTLYANPGEDAPAPEAAAIGPDPTESPSE